MKQCCKYPEKLISETSYVIPEYIQSACAVYKYMPDRQITGSKPW